MTEPEISIEKVRQHITIVRAQHDLADGETDYGVLWKALGVMKESADKLEDRCKIAQKEAQADLWYFQPVDNPKWRVLCRVSTDEVERFVDDKVNTFPEKCVFKIDNNTGFWFRHPEWFVIIRKGD